MWRRFPNLLIWAAWKAAKGIAGAKRRQGLQSRTSGSESANRQFSESAGRWDWRAVGGFRNPRTADSEDSKVCATGSQTADYIWIFSAFSIVTLAPPGWKPRLYVSQDG
jgi:hypothetical protein